MIDYKRVLLALMRGANRRRKLALDEGEIIGWATNESGEHYPIHAAQGGGGGSSGASSGGGKSSSGKNTSGSTIKHNGYVYKKAAESDPDLKESFKSYTNSEGRHFYQLYSGKDWGTHETSQKLDLDRIYYNYRKGHVYKKNNGEVVPLREMHKSSPIKGYTA